MSDYNELGSFAGDLPAPDGGLTPAPSYVLTTQLYSNPAWLTTLAWSKITGTPTTLAGYGITDGGGPTPSIGDTIAVSGDANSGDIFNLGSINGLGIVDNGPVVLDIGANFAVQNDIILASSGGGTRTLNIGAGGTLGTAAFTAASAYQPIDSDLTTIAGLTATTDNFLQAKAGAWASRTIAQVKTDLGLTGTNSGDQTITLTGDVTGSGTGSFATTLATVPVAKGGTGSTTAAGARAALSAAVSGLNNDITGFALASSAAITFGNPISITSPYYLEIGNQTSGTPGTPTAAGRIYFDNSNRLSWKGTNGFTRTFDGTANTANQIYVLPNVSGTLITTGDTGSVTNAMLAGSIAYSKLSLTGAILNADLAGSIATTKLASATTVGGNFLALTNPGAITFPKIAADNTVSTRSAAQLLSDIGGAAAGANTDLTSLSGTTYIKLVGGPVVAGSGGAFLSSDTSGNVSIGMPSTATLTFAISALTGTKTITVPNVNGTMVTTGDTGSVTVTMGGTGLSTLTANSVLLGNGTSAVQRIAPGTSGNVLTSDGTTWASSTPATPASGANPTGTVGLSAVNGSASAFLRSDGAPALSQAIAPTWTGVHTFTPAARSSGSAAFLTITTPADTAQTASTESIGVNKTAATRQFATGALATQREVVFGAPTYSAVGASTITTAVNVDVADPIAGTNVTLTNAYGLRFATAQCTNRILAPTSGSAATPGYTFTGSLGTGMFSLFTDGLSLGAGSSEYVRCGLVSGTATFQVFRAATFSTTVTASANVVVGTPAAHAGGTIFTAIATVSTTSTDGTEDNLISHTTVANTFNANGDSIEQSEHVSFVSSATAARRLKKYFGGTLIFDSGSLTLTLGGEFTLCTRIIRESSTVVRCDVSVTSTSASTIPYSTYTRITGLTLSSTNILKTTGIASGTGAASADILNTYSQVNWFPA